MLSILRSTCSIPLSHFGNNQEVIEHKVAKNNNTFLCIPLPRTWFSSKVQLIHNCKLLSNQETKQTFLEAIKTNYGINESNTGLKAYLNKHDDSDYWTKSDVRKLFRLAKQINKQEHKQTRTEEHKQTRTEKHKRTRTEKRKQKHKRVRKQKQEQIYRLAKQQKPDLQIYEKGTFANKKNKEISRNQSKLKGKAREALVTKT